MSLDVALERAVTAAVERALAPVLRCLREPEPLVYSVPEAAKALATSTNTIRRMVDEGVLPTVPHMGNRVVIPRSAVARLVDSASGEVANGPHRLRSVADGGRASETA
jgi:excisionase family DNA binding protein